MHILKIKIQFTEKCQIHIPVTFNELRVQQHFNELVYSETDSLYSHSHSFTLNIHHGVHRATEVMTLSPGTSLSIRKAHQT